MCTWTRVNKRLRRESGGQTSVNGPEKLKLKFINVRDGGDGLGSGSGPLFRLLLTGAESASATASVYEVGTYCAQDSFLHRTVSAHHAWAWLHVEVWRCFEQEQDEGQGQGQAGQG